MKVVVSAFALLAALSVAGCATTGTNGVVAYSSTGSGYVAGYAGGASAGERALLDRFDQVQADRYAASRYSDTFAYSSTVPGYVAGYGGDPRTGERALLDRLDQMQADQYAASRYDRTVAYSSAAPGAILGQSDYLAQRQLFPPPSDPMGCHRYIIDPDDPCFWYSP